MLIAIPSGWQHEHHASIGSTNERALQLADQGSAGKHWVTASRQLAGRGRRGRTWISEPGNVYASLLLINPAEQENLTTLPLAVALAVHQTLACEIDVPDVSTKLKIKWPNDVLLDGRKISGILLEARRDAFNRLAVAIGIGINVAHHPEQANYPTTSLLTENIDTTTEKLLHHLTQQMEHVLTLWDAGKGFSEIRTRWLSNAAGLNSQITARLPDQEITGTFLDMDTDGLLIMRLDNGMQKRISTADIFFGNSSAIGA